MDTTPTQSGIIKWYDPHKGFGFIIPAAGGGDVFLHKTAVLGSGNPDLRDGIKVTYIAELSKRTGKMQARSVQVASNG